MGNADTAEWIGLNIASLVVLILPAWRDVIPALEHSTEFGLKVLVAVTVIVLNLYKIQESIRTKAAAKRRKPKKKPTP